MSIVPSVNSRALEPLRVRDYRLLFIGLVAGQSMMPLQFIAQIFWIQSETPEDLRVLLVGVLAAVRGLGAISFGLVGGALADRFDRRRLLQVTQSGALITNAFLIATMIIGEGDLPGVTAFMVVTFFTASLFAIDMPTRQALVPELLGPRLAPGGIAMNAAGMQLAMPVSIFASGFAVAAFGFAGAFAVGSAGHVVQLVALAMMTYRAAPVSSTIPAARGRTLGDVVAGVRYVRGVPVISGAILLALLVMCLGMPAVANLGPTWITTEVGVEVRYFGMIAVAWGLGGMVTSVLLTRAAPTMRSWGRVLALAALGFSMAFMIFSVPTVPTAVIGNLGMGASLIAVNIAAASLVQHYIPNEYRGRVMSLLMLSQGGAQLLTFPLAAAGQFASLRVLFPALAITQAVLVVALILLRPSIRRARIERDEERYEELEAAGGSPIVR